VDYNAWPHERARVSRRNQNGDNRESKTILFLSEGALHVQEYLALSNPKHQKWTSYSPSVRKNIETISEHLQVQQYCR